MKCSFPDTVQKIELPSSQSSSILYPIRCQNMAQAGLIQIPYKLSYFQYINFWALRDCTRFQRTLVYYAFIRKTVIVNVTLCRNVSPEIERFRPASWQGNEPNRETYVFHKNGDFLEQSTTLHISCVLALARRVCIACVTLHTMSQRYLDRGALLDANEQRWML